MRLFWVLYHKLTGWKAVNVFPHYLKKAVIIVAPHTSWQDLIIGISFRDILKIRHGKFLGKMELFNGPFGFLFRWLGGIPVDRFSKKGVVEQVVEKFEQSDNLFIVLSPEGTRERVDTLRTGFYYIAKKAKVPVIMVGFDYGKKQVIIAEPFYLTDNEEGDFNKIINFFGPLKGRHPEKGLSHLKSGNINKDYLT